MRGRLTRTLAVATAVAFAAVGCGGDDEAEVTTSGAAGADAGTSAVATGAEDGTATAAAGGGETIKIGLLAPLQGGAAADGALMRQGAELAVKELNDAGGVAGYRFELKVGDVQDQKPDAVASAVSDMIGDEDVKAVVTGYASLTNFEIDTFAQAKMPYLLSGGSAQTQGIVEKDPSKYGTIWSLAPSYDSYGTELPKFLERLAGEGKLTLRDKSAFIVTSDNPYSKGISDGLKKTMGELGWKVAGEETVPFGPVNDWGTVLQKIRSANPDLIVNTDYQPANEATFLNQFLQKPTDSIMFIQYGPSVPEFLELTKERSTGVLYNLLAGPIQSPKWEPATEVVERFKGAYDGADPGVYGAALYDQVKLYAAALEQVGDPDRKEEIGAAIGAMQTETSFGPLRFDPETHLAAQGDDAIPLQFLQIVDGKRNLISPDAYKTADFVLPPWYR